MAHRFGIWRFGGWLGGWHIDFSLDLVGGFPLYLRCLPSFISISMKAFHSTLHTLSVFLVGTNPRQSNCVCLSVQHFHRYLILSRVSFRLLHYTGLSFPQPASLSLPHHEYNFLSKLCSPCTFPSACALTVRNSNRTLPSRTSRLSSPKLFTPISCKLCCSPA